MANILVIDDEPALRRLLERLLTGAGHVVTTAGSGRDGLHEALGLEFDLIILDLMMPDLSGDEVLAALVSLRSSCRVMVLSSVTETSRRVRVLDGGAVDFVAKPFVNSELLSRVRARLREPRPATTPVTQVVAEGVELDAVSRQLIAHGRHIPLSQREYLLIAYLMQRQGSVCSRQDLLSHVWGVQFDPGTNVVDVCVRRLRKKSSADLIETVRNVGYRLAAG